jgi:hypothetical protein
MQRLIASMRARHFTVSPRENAWNAWAPSTRQCEHCGEYKREAIDICTHPDVPCNRRPPEDA